MTLADIIRNVRPVMNQLTSWDVNLINEKGEIINDIQFQLIEEDGNLRVKMLIR